MNKRKRKESHKHGWGCYYYLGGGCGGRPAPLSPRALVKVVVPRRRRRRQIGEEDEDGGGPEITGRASRVGDSGAAEQRGGEWIGAETEEREER
jgi:hypothetical protein